MESPDAGDVMRGTGGVRKLRFAPPSWHTGKSSATRVCYVAFVDAVCYLFTLFPKNEKANLSAADRPCCEDSWKLFEKIIQRSATGDAEKDSI